MSTRIGVYYLDRLVGELTGIPTETLFQYDTAFLGSGIELSPFLLKLSPTPYRGHLRTFDYLPPLFSDSLPDRFGRTIMDQWFTQKMGLGYRPTPLERLAYVGETGMGALCYRPGLEAFSDAVLREFDLRRQEKLARSSRGKVPSDFIEAARKAARTVGGSFPKALCAEDPESGLFYEDDPRLPASFKRWILKFGVAGKDRDDLLNYPEVEIGYNRMARDAGITVPDCRLLASDSGDVHHFAIERFDLAQGRRIHMQTLSAITGIPATEQTLDYRNFLSTTHALTGDISQVKEAFRRMVFNVVSHNVDDHAKNHSYLYEDGAWRLSPAYDLTFADVPNPDSAAVAARAMPVGGKVVDIKRKDIVRLGERSGLSKADCVMICEEVFTAVSRLPSYLSEARVPDEARQEISRKVDRALDEFRGH